MARGSFSLGPRLVAYRLARTQADKVVDLPDERSFPFSIHLAPDGGVLHVRNLSTDEIHAPPSEREINAVGPHSFFGSEGLESFVAPRSLRHGFACA